MQGLTYFALFISIICFIASATLYKKECAIEDRLRELIDALYESEKDDQ